MELVASAILLALSAVWSVARGIDLGAVLWPTTTAIAQGVGAGLALALTLPPLSTIVLRHEPLPYGADAGTRARTGAPGG